MVSLFRCLYVVLTSLHPLQAYLCKEGLARFCTKPYESPTPENASDAFIHISNTSINAKSTNFNEQNPFDVDTRASTRPMATVLAQIAAHEAALGRPFDEKMLYDALGEVCVVARHRPGCGGSQSLAGGVSCIKQKIKIREFRRPIMIMFDF